MADSASLLERIRVVILTQMKSFLFNALTPLCVAGSQFWQRLRNGCVVRVPWAGTPGRGLPEQVQAGPGAPGPPHSEPCEPVQLVKLFGLKFLSYKMREIIFRFILRFLLARTFL